MNIFLTSTAYPPSIGGAQIHAHMFARMMKKKHSVSVCCMWDSNRTDWLLGTTLFAPSESLDYTFDGMAVHRIGLSIADKMRMAPHLFYYYLAMKRAIEPISLRLEKSLLAMAKDAHVIQNIRIGREPFSYASLHTARKLSIPFFFTPVHHPRWKGWRYQCFIRLYLSADGILALTQAEKQVLIELGVKEERIFVTGIGPVLANNADPAEFLAKNMIDGPMVLFLGQHYPYKGYRQVLQAAELVWQKNPETHFVFIGPSIGNSDKEFAARKDRRIHRIGKVDVQEKTNAVAACDLLCVPSTQESFGGVYTEAWSFAKPVIGCAIPAVSEVISDAQDGFLVDQEPNDIAEKICHLLNHPADARIMGENGRKKVQVRYTWDRIAERAEEGYLKIFGGHGKTKVGV